MKNMTSFLSSIFPKQIFSSSSSSRSSVPYISRNNSSSLVNQLPAFDQVDHSVANKISTSNILPELDLDQTVIKGQQLASLVINEVAGGVKAPRNQRDEVFESICSCVNDILIKHEILFRGMVSRIQVYHYYEFASIANELFEANSNNEIVQLRITWGRVLALFAFSVRLSKEYISDAERVNSVIDFLKAYLTKHVIPFVKDNGGWNGLVEQFPPPSSVEGSHQLRNTILISGLCFGLAASMYVSSFLRQ